MRGKTALMAAMIAAGPAAAQGARTPLQPADVFDLEYASDAQVSPDGRSIAYVRRSFDIMTDKPRSNIWLVDVATGAQRPLLSGTASFTSPRWSPDGARLAFVSAFDRDPQLYVRWMDTGSVARVTNLAQPPGDLAWSPDGTRLAFSMFVADEAKPFASTMPKPPKGATWAAAPKVIDQLTYRADGRGYLEQGNRHVFVVAADGGSPRQLTRGAFDDGSPEWAGPRALVFSANRNADHEREPGNSEIYRVDADSGAIAALTTRPGPDAEPAVSPDGRRIAYVGYDDRYQGAQRVRLYVMDADGANRRELLAGLDRDASQPAWAADGRGVYFSYDDEGVTRLGLATLDGKWRALAGDLGGEDLGRPYGGGSFSVARGGTVAFTVTSPEHPGDVAVLTRGGSAKRLTRLNDSLFRYRALGEVEPLTAASKDGTPVGAWIIKPPGFDPAKKYPLILEIHGGPFANYGPRFTTELQMFAAAGYVVVYANPRGSTSYGEAFANHIHHAYPGDDYDDLMAAVDATIAKGYVDPAQLYVTGGSGGGVLTAWIVGKTDRFRAAVVAKPVINWTSFVLTADSPGFFWRYWFGEQPWAAGAQANYWRRSPLSLVGNVKTPTMVLTGEEDWRTPISESEQYYTALKLRDVPTALVRVPEASHALVTRPSQLVAKTQYILAWFARHRAGAAPTVAASATTAGPTVAGAGGDPR